MPLQRAQGQQGEYLEFLLHRFDLNFFSRRPIEK